MQIIDLLNKIANGEKVPKKIKYNNYILTYDEYTEDYYDEPSCTYALLNDIHDKLNDEIEIIEYKNIEEYQKALDETMSEKMDLEHIIKKAIKYLKTYACYEEDTKEFCRDLDYGYCLKLLNILKGEDND